MLVRRSWWWLPVVASFAFPLAGCGYSEEELQMRLNEQRKADAAKAQAELDAAEALRRAGLQVYLIKKPHQLKNNN